MVNICIPLNSARVSRVAKAKSQFGAYLCDFRSAGHRTFAGFLFLMTLGLLTTTAFGFQILPKVSDVDRKVSGLGSNWILDPLAQFGMRGALPLVKNPVHEAITLAAIGCNASAGEEKDCVVLEAVKANRILLYGVTIRRSP